MIYIFNIEKICIFKFEMIYIFNIEMICSPSCLKSIKTVWRWDRDPCTMSASVFCRDVDIVRSRRPASVLVGPS